ncbi:hypothetical protein FKW77_006140 [Venturia effusa]|uniref:Peptide hydrolase n=1 Tax=Venturia effusa TaxID=50376 RepID=A0A517LN40_9PEZI|nr:hypothetical protein FKW77_006140 [Venturia effusa]
MRLTLYYVAVLSAVSSISAVSPYDTKPKVDSTVLQAQVKLSKLLGHAKALEAIAYKTPDRNRAMGTPGHEATVKYIKDQLTLPVLENYYDVTLQTFNFSIMDSAVASVVIDGKNTTVKIGYDSPSGKFNTSIVLILNNGCDESDYPPSVKGKIALIIRGRCIFADKSSLAGRQGAVAVIVYNNGPGTFSFTVEDKPAFGPLVPIVSISGEDGNTLVDSIKKGHVLNAEFDVKTSLRFVNSTNILAQSKHGDPENILQLGAHSDSVPAGPGINDDGSGVSALIEVAILLSGYKIRNRVVFSWWTGEELGDVGSDKWVVSKSDQDLLKIKAYLNFDMLASPNFEYQVLDGDGAVFNKPGPAGSASIEKLFIDYLKGRGLNYSFSEVEGPSDFEPFQFVDVPIGGLSTGDDKNKTKEGVEKFGGVEGQKFDPNNHSARDTVANLNTTAFLTCTQAVAHAVATYANSFESIKYPGTKREVTTAEKRKRDAARTARMAGRPVVRRKKVYYRI